MKRIIVVVCALAVGACNDDGDAPEPSIIIDVCSADDCAVDFGTVVVSDPETRTLLIGNRRAESLTPSIALAPGSDPSFSVVDAPGAIPAQATGELLLALTASGDGDVAGTVVVVSGDDSFAIELSGTGLCPLAVSPTTCDFGDVAIDSEAFCDVTVTAPAGCAGHITLAEVNGGGVFALVGPPTLPLAVPASSSTILQVRAAPTAGGVAIGTFVVNGTTITLRADS